METTISVYLEVGNRRTLAGAIDWPGWCRSGKDETAALQALLEYSPRYASITRLTHLDFRIPRYVSEFSVVERLHGTSTTDFGVPDRAPAVDALPMDDTSLRHQQVLLTACWQAFDAVVEMAQGRTLRTGPRGGGRTLDKIVQHVISAEVGYLTRLGGKILLPDTASASQEPLRQVILATLEASARGEIAEFGPRGGKRWSPGYFTRREAWHVVDHIWEIEDRLRSPAE